MKLFTACRHRGHCMACSFLHSQFFFAMASPALGNPNLLEKCVRSGPVNTRERNSWYIYLNPASMVSFVLRPRSFSSRLIRVAAAERPMKRANTGSATLDMRYTGAGMLMIDKCAGLGAFGDLVSGWLNFGRAWRLRKFI